MRLIALAKPRLGQAQHSATFAVLVSLVGHGCSVRTLKGCRVFRPLRNFDSMRSLERPMAMQPAIDNDELAAALLPALFEAGRLEMAHFTAGVVFEKKADRSPVTIADQEAEAVLLKALEAFAPHIPVVAEEATSAGVAHGWQRRFFLVDALDGTRLFIRNKPEFSINVALVEDGKALFGAILSPPTGRLFLTRSDGHAYETQLDLVSPQVCAFSSLEFRRLSTREPNGADLVAFNSRGAGGAASQLLATLNVTDARPLGSAMKFCLIAAGEGDLYVRFGETSEWDTAAGQAILEAAGGCVVKTDGSPLTYGHADRSYVNPHFIAWGRQPLWRQDGDTSRVPAG